jgi:uncharacterized membrane protein
MESILPGWKALLNVHPMFVHFPIAFWLGALLFELLALVAKKDEFHRTGLRLLYLGTLAAPLAIFTGLDAEASVPQGAAHEVAETHKYLMIAATAVAAALSMLAALRRELTPGLRRLLLLGLVALAVLVALGADRGAQLVYQYGTGVDWSTALPQR